MAGVVRGARLLTAAAKATRHLRTSKIVNATAAAQCRSLWSSAPLVPHARLAPLAARPHALVSSGLLADQVWLSSGFSGRFSVRFQVVDGRAFSCITHVVALADTRRSVTFCSIGELTCFFDCRYRFEVLFFFLRITVFVLEFFF